MRKPSTSDDLVKVTPESNEAGPFWTFTVAQPRYGYEAWVALNENGDYLAVVRSDRQYRRTMKVYRDLAEATAWVTSWVIKNAVER